MPEVKDTSNTTDQNRSGGKQTQKERGAAAGQGIDGGYGKAEGDPTSAQRPGEAFADEEQRREEARDSKHQDSDAQKWSPGTDQPES